MPQEGMGDLENILPQGRVWIYCTFAKKRQPENMKEDPIGKSQISSEAGQAKQ